MFFKIKNRDNFIKKEKCSFIDYFLYSLGFFLIVAIILSWLKFKGVFPIYDADALVQHYPTQFFLKNYFREIFSNFLGIFSGNFSGFRDFNFNLGFGQDVLTTYHYYGLTNPINLIIGFVNVNPKLMYELMYVLRVFLSGISFIFMCRYIENHKKVDEVKGGLQSDPIQEELGGRTFRIEYVLGALIYVFSNYCLTPGIMHPYFINTMILLPLMIVGVKRLVVEDKVGFFIMISSLSIFINFYFSYMIALFSFFYAVFTILENIRKNGIIISTNIFLRGIISYIISILISSVVLLPVIYGYFNSYRSVGRDFGTEIIMGKDLIIDYFFNMFKAPSISNFALVGISVVVLLSIISLFINSGRLKIKLMFAMMMFLALSPVLHSAFNFFSYANMRWYFGLVLLFSYIFVDQFEVIFSLSKIRKVIMSIIAVLCIISYSYKQIDEIYKTGFRITTTIIEFLPVIFTVIFLASMFVLKGKNRIRVFSMMVVFSVLLNSVVYAKRTAELKLLVENESVDKMSYDKSLYKISKLTKHSFDRVENYSSYSFNMSDIYDYPSVSVYYSLENRNLSEFNLKYKNSQAVPINSMRGLDSRAILESIFSVKYYYGDAKIPYGFEREGSSEEKIFVNKNYLPFGFTYDTYVDERRIEGMDTLDRQDVLMKSGVIRGELAKNFSIEKIDESKMSEISLKKSEVEFRKISENSWFRYKDSLKDLESQYIGYDKNTGDLSTDIAAGDAKIYSGADKINDNTDKNTTDDENITKNNLGAYEKSIIDGKKFEITKIEDELEKSSEKIDKNSKILVKKGEKSTFLYDLKYPAEVYLRVKNHAAFKDMENVYIESEKNIAKVDIIRPESNWYSGEEEIIYNLGYFDAGKHSFKIIPSSNGKIDVGKLSLDARSLSNLDVDAKMLREEHLKDIDIGVDEFSGNIDVSKDKLMFISIAYSDGWKAFVDGKEEKIYNSSGFMAIPLKKGRHKIEFRYSRPYQKSGMVLSVLGVALFIFFIFLRRKKEKSTSYKKDMV